jgi:hypothetical protein
MENGESGGVKFHEIFYCHSRYITYPKFRSIGPVEVAQILVTRFDPNKQITNKQRSQVK